MLTRSVRQREPGEVCGGESVRAAFSAADLILWYNRKSLRGRDECRCRRDKTDFPRREAKNSSPTPADMGRVT